MNTKNNSTISRFFGALIILFCFVAVSGSAHAAFIAYICDDALCTGGGDVIVTDQGVGDNFPGSAALGQINSGALNIGGFTIVTNVAQSKPLIGSASEPQLDLTFSAVTSDNGTHTVYLYASDTGFTGTGGTAILTFGGIQSLGGANSVTATAYGGTSNTNLNLSNTLVALSGTSSSPFAMSGSTAFTPSVNPYGLTIGVQITRGAAGTTTGDLNFAVSAVPEPSTWSLFGLGGLASVGLTLLRGRRAA